MTSRPRLRVRFAAVTVIAASLLLAVSGARAQSGGKVTLKIGDPAPALSVGKWVKGGPVAKIEPGKYYVVEFWATWCAPCKAAIPHLTDLAKKHKEVTFIGQDVFEEDETEVAPFVEKMGDQIGYAIATDDKSKDKDGAMVATWLTAAGYDSIPTAFVVDKDSKIAWIGDPMELDAVLEKVVGGTYDLKAEADKANQLNAIDEQIRTAMQAKDTDGVLKATKRLAELKPELAVSTATFEFNLLNKAGRTDEARTRAQKIVSEAKSPGSLNAVAWVLATGKDAKPEDLKLAHAAANRANDMTGGAQATLLDTSARVYAVESNWDKAIELQTSAVAKASEGEEKTTLQKTLEAYQKHTVPPAE